MNRLALWSSVNDTPLCPLLGASASRLTQGMGGALLRTRLPRVVPLAPHPLGAGHDVNAGLLAGLPSSIDQHGERGEFDTFAPRGLMFDRPIAIEPGVIVERDRFVFADMLPVGPTPT